MGPGSRRFSFVIRSTERRSAICLPGLVYSSPLPEWTRSRPLARSPGDLRPASAGQFLSPFTKRLETLPQERTYLRQILDVRPAFLLCQSHAIAKLSSGYCTRNLGIVEVV